MIGSVYLNTAIGSFLVIFVILSDYTRKYNTDFFQRRLFLAVLAVAFLATLMDLINRLLAGIPGIQVRNTMYFAISVFLVAQNCTYYLAALFIDYFAYNNMAKTKKMMQVIGVLLIIYTVSVVANLYYGYYFNISPDNYYSPGRFYILRLIISYFPIVVILLDIFSAINNFKRSQILSIILFMLITAIGAGIDVILKFGSLAWPCFTAALLYLYFFILQIDSKLDSLTGLGNRYSFNEFINKLSRQNTKEDYSIVMIDLDRFKLINDTFGHLEGDNALRDMAAIIKGCIRHSDFAARYGGDEFILATKAEYDIQRLMNRIQEHINLQNGKNTRPYQLYMSYGYDIFTTNSGQSIQEFLRKIEILMYKQKLERRQIFEQEKPKSV